MQTVYVLIEDDPNELGTGDIVAIVKTKKEAKQFINDYQKDPDNYMMDIDYEEWQVTSKYDDLF